MLSCSHGRLFSRVFRLEVHYRSRLIERGHDIPEIAQFPLHESWTIWKRYTHLGPEQVVEREVKVSA